MFMEGEVQHQKFIIPKYEIIVDTFWKFLQFGVELQISREKKGVCFV